MHKLLFFFFFPLLVACSSKPSGPDAAQLAANAAKTYYEQLLKGDYGSFVDGRYQPTALPESYRQQGIKGVAVADGRADTAKHVANAFLTFTYGDGTKEQVVVPMVEVKKVWYMR